jgi:protein-S-isoprenylcysteine O-methyltransferase Ste14
MAAGTAKGFYIWKMPLHRKYRLPLLLVVQLVVLRILALFPSVVERFYSNGIYPYLSQASRFLLGWIPFSVGDVIYVVLIVLLLRWFVKRRKTWRAAWKDNLLTLVGFVSVGYLLFNLLWGINYHREKLSVRLQIEAAQTAVDTIPYTDAELMEFTQKLIARINDQHRSITRNDSVKVVLDLTSDEVLDQNIRGYEAVSKTHPFLVYKTASVKASMLSLPLTYMGFAGYLNPFTAEAQSNVRVPRYQLPMIGSHEMAHQIGYASESEANFVGFLAVTHHPDPKFRYSGYATALVYCLGQWEVRDLSVYEELLAQVNPGILENYRESREFWQSHESFIETGFKIFYDNFLKLNQQDGLESYSRFVDLMVHYYKNHPL